VNQQPPMTSRGWGRSSCFGDEPKAHPPLPKVFGFFSLFSAPKFFPPTYLPPTYLPLLPPSPTSLPPIAPLLPTSPHFALNPTSELGSAWNGSHHC
jgi:hypothetical protein